jgi:hypothetical protein
VGSSILFVLYACIALHFVGATFSACLVLRIASQCCVVPLAGRRFFRKRLLLRSSCPPTQWRLRGCASSVRPAGSPVKNMVALLPFDAYRYRIPIPNGFTVRPAFIFFKKDFCTSDRTKFGVLLNGYRYRIPIPNGFTVRPAFIFFKKDFCTSDRTKFGVLLNGYRYRYRRVPIEAPGVSISEK